MFTHGEYLTVMALTTKWSTGAIGLIKGSNLGCFVIEVDRGHLGRRLFTSFSSGRYDPCIASHFGSHLYVLLQSDVEYLGMIPDL